MANNQPTGTPESETSTPSGESMAAEFDRYDQANPRVFEVFKDLSREWVRRTGRNRLGIGALTERVRWEMAMETDDPDYKINNNYRAFYARKLGIECPDLTDLFVMRTSVADEWASDYIARKHAEEYGIPSEGLFAIDLPRQRNRGDR